MMKVYDTLIKYNMTAGVERVLCALSGGMDSVVLTHFLATNAQKLGITVCAAHFSHGIRKDSANAEKALCQSLCDKLGIELVCGEGDSIAYAAENKMGLEQAARELRYNFLKSAAKQLGADRIATAHHADDNVETVIMNACRGSGVKGMCGIPPVRDEFIRPLIETYRAEVEDYATANNLNYATDLTNFEPCCRRNRIRLLDLPRMREIYPDFERVINRLSGQARVYNDRLNCQAENLVRCCNIRNSELSVELDAMLGADKAVIYRAFEIICRMAGSDSMLSSRHLDSLYRLCTSNDPSASVDLPGLKVCRRYGSLVFAKPVCKTVYEDTLIGMGDSVTFGDWQIELTDGRRDGAYHADATKLSFPLLVRSRREGDRIFMGGMHKSVKKLMIDRKIPKEMRDNIPVLLDNNRVVAIAGIGFDRSYASDKEINIISIYFRRIEL